MPYFVKSESPPKKKANKRFDANIFSDVGMLASIPSIQMIQPTSPKTKKISISLPAELHQKGVERALAQSRKFSQHIQHLLRADVEKADTAAQLDN